MDYVMIIIINIERKKIKKQVDNFSKLEYNWDSYGAKPFSQKTINKVNEVIDILDNNYPILFIVPGSCGI